MIISAEQLAQVSMKMISYSGEAREFMYEAIKLIKEQNDTEASLMLKKAEDKLVQAHKEQTVIIQQSFQDDVQLPYSVLFTHAQDTMMCIQSEFNMMKIMLELYTQKGA